MYPNLFSIGPFTLHSYGLMLALAFLLGLQLALYYGKREGMSPGPIVDLVFYIFVSALIGAKLMIIVVDFDYYSEDWSRILGIYRVGGVFYGGLLLALLVSAWYMRRHKMDFWQTADVFSMGIVAGQAVGRLGCFLAGCCWGTEAPPDFPLSVVFTNPFAQQQVGTPLGIPLYPVQLFEAGALLIIFLALVFSFQHRRFLGQQLFLYLILYSTARFLLEFLRGDPRGSVFGGMMSTSQFLSILLFAAALVVFVIRRNVAPGLEWKKSPSS